MQMYLTAKPSGERLQIPLLPDSLNVRTGAMTIASQIINVGEIKIPRGTNLIGYSWNGTLPGPNMRSMPFITAWREPKSIIAQIEDWVRKGQTLAFMVTEATINKDVFIESFNYEYTGVGNVNYNITLTMKRALTIKTAPPPPAPPPKPAPGQTTPSRWGRIRLSNTNGAVPVLYEPRADARVLDYWGHDRRIEIVGQSGAYYMTPHINGANGQGYILMRHIVLEPAPATPSTAPPQPSRPSKPLKPNTTGENKPGTPVTTVTKPFETIADIARRTYNSNTFVKTIVDANRPTLTKIANTAKSIIGTITSGIKLALPNVKPQNQAPSKAPKSGGGGGGGGVRATMMKY